MIATVYDHLIGTRSLNKAWVLLPGRLALQKVLTSGIYMHHTLGFTENGPGPYLQTDGKFEMGMGQVAGFRRTGGTQVLTAQARVVVARDTSPRNGALCQRTGWL